MIETWSAVRKLATQDLGALTSNAVASLDRSIGVLGRRAVAGTLLAASLFGAGLLYSNSKPVEPVYQARAISYTITDTIPSSPQEHIVKPGESLWRILEVKGEPAAATAARVKQVCAQNQHLPQTDNRSVRRNKVYNEPDGIGCDYLPVGASITLPSRPQIVQRKHEAVVYDLQSPAKQYSKTALFFATMCFAGAIGAGAFTFRSAYLTAKRLPLEASLRTVLPLKGAADPHEKYKPKGAYAR